MACYMCAISFQSKVRNIAFKDQVPRAPPHRTEAFHHAVRR